MQTQKTKFQFTLRKQLTLVALTLLLIPWIGYRYVQAVEEYLRAGREAVLLERSRTLAALLAQQPEVFARRDAGAETAHVFVRPLRTPVQLDGYGDEWEAYKDRTQSFGKSSVLFTAKEYLAGSLSYRVQLGSYKGDVYALFHIVDDALVYRDPRTERFDDSDHLELDLEGADGRVASYVFATSAPGWVGVYRMPGEDEDEPVVDPHIKAEWQEARDGYSVELRIPQARMGSRMAFRVVDVDDAQQRTIVNIVGMGKASGAQHLTTVGVAAPQVQNILRGLTSAGTRTWVVDGASRVIALEGGLKPRVEDAYTSIDAAARDSPLGGESSHLLFRWLLRQPAEEFQDDLSAASHLSGTEVAAALRGEDGTRWRQTPDGRVGIVTAATPIRIDGAVVGAVAVEETGNGILLLQNRALETMIADVAIVFSFVFGVLLAYAGWLSARVRRLRDGAESAIAPDGRVRDIKIASDARDELGDLSRSFAQMLERLAQYNRYLEGMAGRLSHELRTPVSVVRSSLDNLETARDDFERQMCLRHAREGIARLADLLARMSEATRLEQTLQREQRVAFDPEEVVAGCVAGYRIAHPTENFGLTVRKTEPELKVTLHGAPELIAQLLDKLVTNALDFHEAGSAIDVQLELAPRTVIVRVANRGSQLPAEMGERLFDSMVSVRAQRDAQPHLGLGLYIVRLIAEFHRGRVKAENRPDGSGVVFSVELPVD